MHTLVVERLALVWFGAAVPMVAMRAAADDASVPLDRMLQPGRFGAGIGTSETAGLDRRRHRRGDHRGVFQTDGALGGMSRC